MGRAYSDERPKPTIQQPLFGGVNLYGGRLGDQHQPLRRDVDVTVANVPIWLAPISEKLNTALGINMKEGFILA